MTIEPALFPVRLTRREVLMLPMETQRRLEEEVCLRYEFMTSERGKGMPQAFIVAWTEFGAEEAS